MIYNQNNLNVAKISERDGDKPALGSVMFTKNKTVAANCYSLLEMSAPSDVKPEAFSKEAMRGCKPFLLPAKEVSKIKIPKKNIAIKHIDVKVIKLFSYDNGDIDIIRIDDKFPEYERLFPIKEPIAEVLINGEMLAKMLVIMSKLSEDTKMVKIKFYEDEKPLVLTADNGNQSCRGLIMPLKK